MLHPSLYFPDYPGTANGPEPKANLLKVASAAHPKRPAPDFQRFVLASGCVLFRLSAVRVKQP
jgi:hypothetical protein